MEDERLDFIRKGKVVENARLRDLARDHDFVLDMDNNQSGDMEENNDDMEENSDDTEINDCMSLPASFTGSPQYFANRTADALALSRQRGKPDFLITATCNPAWPELLQQLQPGQSATEVPHITVRVFKVRDNDDMLFDILSVKYIFTGTSPQAHQGDQRPVWSRLPCLRD